MIFAWGKNGKGEKVHGKPRKSDFEFMKIEQNINRIKALARKMDEENWQFRAFLKGCQASELDLTVHRLYREFASRIDCTTCANCCKEVSPRLSQTDVMRLSEYLGIGIQDFSEKYLETATVGDQQRIRERPCPFLRKNLCTVYEARPGACRSFPHLHKKDFISRTIQVVTNCHICPIVFNVFEELKEEIWRP